MRLEGKVAIVTGAGHGIGRVSRSASRSEGARVAVNDVDRGARRRRSRPRSAASAVAAPADVSDSARSTHRSTSRSSASPRSTCSSTTRA